MNDDTFIAPSMPMLLPGTEVPVRLWTDVAGVDYATQTQLRNVAALPWTRAVAVMPDVHLGYGATIGSVIAMNQALAPSAVGVDIGCGMSAVPTSLYAADLSDSLAPLRKSIEQAVPVGWKGHYSAVNRAEDKHFWKQFANLNAGVEKLESKARSQLGTLGGGNHFIEICLDETSQVWLMLHSGSRNIGKETAERHIEVAAKQEHNVGNKELAVLLAGTPEMDAYRADLVWCQEYAARNRAVMVSLVKKVVKKHYPQVVFGEEISCHHNYVSEETYEGQKLLITRKGAIRAGLGQAGIIPGSMGTRSYIVEGIGNAAAINSASHGAGRAMSRAEAKRRFGVADLVAQTAGVESRKDAGVLDELPGAYKDIDQVMAYQSDLVKVSHTLKQVLCVKG